MPENQKAGADAPAPRQLCGCGEPILKRASGFDGGTMSTLVGYFSPPGHDHDDNCETRYYLCANGHPHRLSVRRRCPACDWRGKTKCFCHPYPKLDEWPPDEPPAGPPEP